jgi:hypothetical protein
MECWSDGVMECWSVGVLECWSVGVLECWSVGVLRTFFRARARTFCWASVRPSRQIVPTIASRRSKKDLCSPQQPSTPTLHNSISPPLLLSVLPWARSAVDHRVIRCSIIPS